MGNSNGKEQEPPLVSQTSLGCENDFGFIESRSPSNARRQHGCDGDAVFVEMADACSPKSVKAWPQGQEDVWNPTDEMVFMSELNEWVCDQTNGWREEGRSVTLPRPYLSRYFLDPTFGDREWTAPPREICTPKQAREYSETVAAMRRAPRDAAVRLVKGLVYRKHSLLISTDQANTVIDLMQAGCVTSTAGNAFREMIENLLAADAAAAAQDHQTNGSAPVGGVNGVGAKAPVWGTNECTKQSAGDDTLHPNGFAEEHEPQGADQAGDANDAIDMLHAALLSAQQSLLSIPRKMREGSREWCHVRQLEEELTRLVSKVSTPSPDACLRYAELSEFFPIVLSYRTEVKADMLRLTQALRREFGPRCVVHGLMCKPGTPWDAGYFSWLEHARVILPLLSNDYFASHACRLELREACCRVPDPRSTEKTVIPIVINKLDWTYPACDPKCPADIKAQLNQRNSFPEGPYNEVGFMADFESNFRKLADLISPFLQLEDAGGGGELSQEQAFDIINRSASFENVKVSYDSDPPNS